MTAPPTLARRLRDATRSIHHAAEHSGAMQSLLKGRLDHAAYCLLLRNLAALYEALELELEAQSGTPGLAALRLPGLFRSAALTDDLQFRYGPGWQRLPVMGAMQRYVARIHALASAQPFLLAAHAYVRYMGDLSGGRILHGVVSRALSLRDADGLAFYAFGNGADLDRLKRDFRSAIDALPLDPEAAEAVIAEAVAGFELHLEVFEELDRAVHAIRYESMPPSVA